jgi:hypothetical protein
MANYVLDPISAFSEKRSVVLLVAFDATTDQVFPIHGMNDKVLLVKNTTAASMDYEVLGSIDNGEEYDIVEKSVSTVGIAASSLYRFDAYYTHIKIRVRGAGSLPAVIKLAATGN